METLKPDPRIVIVTAPFDVDETTEPFGKRWRQEEITLTTEHLQALQAGRYLALDVQGEYVLFVKLCKIEKVENKNS